MPDGDSDDGVTANAAYSVVNTAAPKYPLLISVPHSGREYPSQLIDNLNVSASHLLRLEDRYADRLAASAIASGFPAIVARKPRAWIDLNRSPAEIDPDMVSGMDSSQTPLISKKVRGGLGILPRRLHGAGDLWREKWHHRHVIDRIEQVHAPYHARIEHILKEMRAVFGCAFLLDLHSMPSVFDEKRRQIDFVIGDRFGRSCDSRYAEMAAVQLRGRGHHVQTNHPYPGGFILESHGSTENNIHALQLEVDRALYLDENFREPTDAVDTISDMIRDCSIMLVDQLLGRYHLEAAE